MNISETQYFEDGQSVNEECSIQVFNPRMLRSYFFDASQWGTIELARDAAELFATSGELNCVYHPVGKGASMSFNVLPNNEEAFV